MKKTNHFKKSTWFGKPYNFFGDYLLDKFGSKILKLPINAGFTCPNRDGSLGKGGCIFCSEDGSSSNSTLGIRDIKKQMDSARKNFTRVSSNIKYISYFQSYTNTHAPTSYLKSLYDIATEDSDIIGLMIGTRPDCLPDETLKMISSYRNKKENFELWLEIGVQSMHDKSLKLLNRQHSVKDSSVSIIKADSYGIKTCIHIILGIPGETWQEMMETAKIISNLPISAVKIHHLHVIKDTALEQYYNNDKFSTLSLNEYTSIVADFIERLRPDIQIHRLMGDRNDDKLIAPKWGHHKGTIINAIEDQLKNRHTYQGFLYENNT